MDASGQGKRTDFRGTRATERCSRLERGSAGSSNVVEEEDAQAGAGRPGHEGALYVAKPFAPGKVGLARRMPRATKHAPTNRQLEHPPHPSGEQGRLIVASVPSATPMEGDRNHHVDALPPRKGPARQQRAERMGELDAPFVLETLNCVGQGASVLEDRLRARARLQRDLARRANGGPGLEPFVACRASVRRDELEASAKERAHAPFIGRSSATLLSGRRARHARS